MAVEYFPSNRETNLSAIGVKWSCCWRYLEALHVNGANDAGVVKWCQLHVVSTAHVLVNCTCGAINWSFRGFFEPTAWHLGEGLGEVGPLSLRKLPCARPWRLIFPDILPLSLIAEVRNNKTRISRCNIQKRTAKTK